jgi:adenosine deaminase
MTACQNAANLRFLATEASEAYESFADSLDTLYERAMIDSSEHTDLSLMGDRMYKAVRMMEAEAEDAEARDFIATTAANPEASPEEVRAALEMAAVHLLPKE